MFSETFSKLSNTLDGFIKNLDKEKKIKIMMPLFRICIGYKINKGKILFCHQKFSRVILICHLNLSLTISNSWDLNIRAGSQYQCPCNRGMCPSEIFHKQNCNKVKGQQFFLNILFSLECIVIPNPTRSNLSAIAYS